MGKEYEIKVDHIRKVLTYQGIIVGRLALRQAGRDCEFGENAEALRS